MAKNLLTNLTIAEVSLVDEPANPEAMISLWKRKTPTKEKEMSKFTEKEKADGKSFLAKLFKMMDGDKPADDKKPEDEKPADDETVDPGKTPQEMAAAEAEKKADEELTKAFKKSAEGSLTEEQKAYYDTLDTAGKADFISKDEAGRTEVMLGATEVDQEKEDLKKKLAKSEKEKADLVEKAAMGDHLAKAKAEYGNVAGTPEEKAKLLKFVATVVQKDNTDMAGLIEKIMKQAQANVAAATTETGHDQEVETEGELSDDKDPTVAYNKSIDKIMKANDGMSRDDAIKKLKSTKEGRELYQKSMNPKSK